MQYLINDDSRKYLIETLGLLNKVEVRGIENLTSQAGAIQRVQEIMKNMIEQPDPIIKQPDNNNNQNPNIVP